MYKSYVVRHGDVFIKDDKGRVRAFTYTTNLDEKLVHANKIDYLENRLQDDEEKLSDLEYLRKIMLDGYVKTNACVAGFSFVAALVLGVTARNSGVQVYHTLLGDMGALEAQLKITMPSVILGVQPACMAYLYRSPSKEEISGMREVVRYEKEKLEEVQKIEIDTPLVGCNDNFYDEENHIVQDEEEIGYLKDSINLRYFYGCDKQKVLRMYEDGSLFQLLYSYPRYCEEAVIDFIEFLESELQTFKEKDEISKKMFKKSSK